MPPSPFSMLEETIQADPEYAWSWHCNIAMPIMDSIGIPHELADRAAARIMSNLFNVDTSQHIYYQNPVMYGPHPAKRTLWDLVREDE
jgi:hypothetical protein